MFTIKEGYFLKSNNHHNIALPIWQKIWRTKFWPNVLWFLSHQKTLTWDNLQHRRIQEPSLCMMCKNKDETIEHLFNTCKLAKDISQNNEMIFKQSDRDNTSINENIHKWRKGGFKSEVMNHAWRFSMAFMLWGIWKERNHRIFRGEERNIAQIWKVIVENIRETILVEQWSDEDWAVNDRENRILAKLNLKSSLWKFKPHQQNILNTFQPPPVGFFILNYDGASKGNPGQAGIGGIFRNSQGFVCRIYAMAIGFATNNETELMAVKQGLTIAIRENYQRVIVEGDSAMKTGILQKLQQGIHWDKISKS